MPVRSSVYSTFSSRSVKGCMAVQRTRQVTPPALSMSAGAFSVVSSVTVGSSSLARASEMFPPLTWMSGKIIIAALPSTWNWMRKPSDIFSALALAKCERTSAATSSVMSPCDWCEISRASAFSSHASRSSFADTEGSLPMLALPWFSCAL